MLCARAWTDVRLHHGERSTAASRVGLYFIGPFLVAVGMGCGYFLIARLALPRAAILVAVALTAAGAVLTMLANVRGALPLRVPWVVTSALIVTYAGVVAFVMPALEQRKVVPDMAQWVAARARDGDRIATYRMNRWTPAYRFYVGRHVRMLEDPAEAERFFGKPEPFYCVMRESEYKDLVARGVPLDIVYSRSGLWATTGKALWRQHSTLTTFVVVTAHRDAPPPSDRAL